MTYPTVHCPAPPVYEKLLSFASESRTIPPKKARKSGLTRRGRALLAADVLQHCVDFKAWPVSRIAEAFAASPRSVFEALSLSPAERDDVRAGRRPLFPSRSSVPDPSLTPAQHLRAAIDGLGIE